MERQLANPRKVRVPYETAGDSFWRLAVYGPVHDGWEFTNIGGRAVLDAIAGEMCLDASSRVLELCSGFGANCRYLSDRYGCSATGVEIEAGLVEHARRAAAPGSHRVRFLEDDVTQFLPRDSYDLVLSMDSLLLTREVETVLLNAGAALKTEGVVLVAEVALGSTGNPAALRDLGLTRLLGLEELRYLFHRAGLTITRVDDLTHLGHACFHSIGNALVEQEAELLAVSSVETLATWKVMTEYYRRAFRERDLLYLGFVATARMAA